MPLAMSYDRGKGLKCHLFWRFPNGDKSAIPK
jgi:hypothetical protein